MPRQADFETEGNKSQEWTLGTGTSSRSFEVESWSYVQHKDYQLHLLQKPVKAPLNRPVIPATELQRLMYFRWNATSTFKLQINYVQQLSFSAFYWVFLQNLIFRTMPMNYVHVFLAAYNPDEHMFTSKMSPLCIGVAWMSVLCGLFQLVTSAKLLKKSMHYAIFGILNSSPWTRCPSRIMKTKSGKSYFCFDMNEFLAFTKNMTYESIDKKDYSKYVGQNKFTFENTRYVVIDDNFTQFTASSQQYFTSLLEMSTLSSIPMYVIIWLAAALCYKQLFKTRIWKVITYQLLVEMVVCEWRWARRWIATIIISALGLTGSLLVTGKVSSVLYVYATMISSVAEAVVMFWLYPLGRLLDDIYFHTGEPIPKVLEYMLTIVPFYYFYKVFRFHRAYGDFVIHSKGYPSELRDALAWAWMPSVVVFALGSFFAIIKYLIKDRQNWRVLFRPRPDWGPREHVTRQLRKQFDSRDYIGSQASRYLSRNMLSKAQTPSYRLDIRFETAAERRRSTIIGETFKFVNKNVD